MGVSAVHAINIPEGKSGQQIVDSLVRLIEARGAKRTGIFSVESETFTSAPHIQPQRTLQLLHVSEFPATAFALLDNGTCLVADSSLDAILAMLGGCYNAKKSNRMECRGPRYVISDFVVKIGSCSIGPHLKGILVEVEYTPSQVPTNCWDLIKEFVGGWIGPHVTNSQQYLLPRMTELYSPLDTAQQYNEHFHALRKAIK